MKTYIAPRAEALMLQMESEVMNLLVGSGKYGKEGVQYSNQAIETEWDEDEEE